MNTAYVYAIKVDGITRYYGKGTKKRALDHMREVRSIARRRAAGDVVETSQFYERLTAAWLAGSEIDIEIVADGMTHREALDLETRLISGTLAAIWNVKLPWRMTDKQRENHLRSVQADEWRAKQSEKYKGLWQKPGYREAFRSGVDAWVKSDKGRAFHREHTRKTWQDPAIRERRSLATKLGKQRQHANDMPARVLKFIRSNPGSTSADIRSEFNLSLRQVNPIIHRLRWRGEIEKRGKYHGGQFYAVDSNVIQLTA